MDQCVPDCNRAKTMDPCVPNYNLAKHAGPPFQIHWRSNSGKQQSRWVFLKCCGAIGNWVAGQMETALPCHNHLPAAAKSHSGKLCFPRFSRNQTRGLKVVAIWGCCGAMAVGPWQAIWDSEGEIPRANFGGIPSCAASPDGGQNFPAVAPRLDQILGAKVLQLLVLEALVSGASEDAEFLNVQADHYCSNKVLALAAERWHEQLGLPEGTPEKERSTFAHQWLGRVYRTQGIDAVRRAVTEIIGTVNELCPPRRSSISLLYQWVQANAHRGWKLSVTDSDSGAVTTMFRAVLSFGPGRNLEAEGSGKDKACESLANNFLTLLGREELGLGRSQVTIPKGLILTLPIPPVEDSHISAAAVPAPTVPAPTVPAPTVPATSAAAAAAKFSVATAAARAVIATTLPAAGVIARALPAATTVPAAARDVAATTMPAPTVPAAARDVAVTTEAARAVPFLVMRRSPGPAVGPAYSSSPLARSLPPPASIFSTAAPPLAVQVASPAGCPSPLVTSRAPSPPGLSASPSSRSPPLALFGSKIAPPGSQLANPALSPYFVLRPRATAEAGPTPPPRATAEAGPTPPPRHLSRTRGLMPPGVFQIIGS